MCIYSSCTCLPTCLLTCLPTYLPTVSPGLRRGRFCALCFDTGDTHCCKFCDHATGGLWAGTYSHISLIMAVCIVKTEKSKLPCVLEHVTTITGELGKSIGNSSGGSYGSSVPIEHSRSFYIKWCFYLDNREPHKARGSDK